MWVVKQPIQAKVILITLMILLVGVSFIATTGSFNQAAGRISILSYFYGLLILRSAQVAGTYSVARRQVADSQRACGCVHMCAHVCICA